MARDPRIVAAKARRLASRRINLAEQRVLERMGRPPVLVFAWSKTGSSTLFETLKYSHLLRPVYKAHELDDELEKRLAETAVSKNNLGLNPEQQRSARVMRAYLASGASGLSMATLVRDPMSRAISSFFQRHHSSGIDMTREPTPESVAATVELLHRMLPALITSTDAWFDRQMVGVFDVDLFELPFDPRAGYARYEHGRFDQVVMRLDRFRDVYREALTPVLGRRPGKIRDRNISTGKSYEAHRRATLAEFRASAEEIDLAADSQVTRHYFSDDERDALLAKWRHDD